MVVPEMLPEFSPIVVVILAAGAELLHAGRVRKVASLVFGKSQKPSYWAMLAAPLRIIALGLLCWGLMTLMPVSYTHLRAHETGRNLVCRLLL